MLCGQDVPIRTHLAKVDRRIDPNYDCFVFNRHTLDRGCITSVPPGVTVNLHSLFTDSAVAQVLVNGERQFMVNGTRPMNHLSHIVIEAIRENVSRRFPGMLNYFNNCTFVLSQYTGGDVGNNALADTEACIKFMDWFRREGHAAVKCKRIFYIYSPEEGVYTPLACKEDLKDFFVNTFRRCGESMLQKHATSTARMKALIDQVRADIPVDPHLHEQADRSSAGRIAFKNGNVEKFNSESNAGAAVGVVMLLLLIKFYRVPVVVAVMMAMRHSASAFWSLGTAVTGLVINAHGPLRVARSPSESLSRTLSRTLSRKRNVAKVALLRKVLRLHYAMGILEGMKGVQSNINMECIRQIMEGIGFKYDDDHMDASPTSGGTASAGMGQALSVRELQAAVEADFSGQLRVLYALQPHAYGFATHSVCELAQPAPPLPDWLPTRLVAHTIPCRSFNHQGRQAHAASAAEEAVEAAVDVHEGGTGDTDSDDVLCGREDAVGLAAFLAELDEESEEGVDVFALADHGCRVAAPSPLSLASPADSTGTVPTAAPMLAWVETLFPGCPLLRLGSKLEEEEADGEETQGKQEDDGDGEEEEQEEAGEEEQTQAASEGGGGDAEGKQEEGGDGEEEEGAGTEEVAGKGEGRLEGAEAAGSWLMRHDGRFHLLPPLAAAWAPAASHLHLLYPAARFDVASMLRFSPAALGEEEQVRLLLYQLLLALDCLHRAGTWHGRVHAGNLLLPEYGGLWLSGWRGAGRLYHCASCSAAEPPSPSTPQQDGAAPAPSPPLPAGDWAVPWAVLPVGVYTAAWRARALSNLDYLLALNRLAGRTMGNDACHPIVPWVIDMSTAPEEGGGGAGWRDLRKTKWRLTKGDEQLDATYATADIPHHISDEALSELALCIYKAGAPPCLFPQLAAPSSSPA
eukprot:jgi/Tetstr1/433585/TSEL_022852.t1